MLLHLILGSYYIQNIFKIKPAIKIVVSNSETAIRVPIKFLRMFLHFLKIIVLCD